MMHRIRAAMADDPAQSRLLHGIVEADETYVGGKPRKRNRHDDEPPRKRGRGTKKTPIIGAIERGGRVVAKPAQRRDLSARGLADFIRRNVDHGGTLLITDEYKGYRRIQETMFHATVNHGVEYANGSVHTNTIEGFWALVKRAWYGQHHHYSKKYMPLYISEACFKYNHRNAEDVFTKMIGVMVAA